MHKMTTIKVVHDLRCGGASLVTVSQVDWVYHDEAPYVRFMYADLGILRHMKGAKFADKV